MAASTELQSAITNFNDNAPNPSGISFPTTQDVVSKRLKSQGYSYESIKTIPPDSPVMVSTTNEIQHTKTLINHVINQLPLLAVPITAALALQQINAHLPAALAGLHGLGIDPPETLLPVLKAMSIATTVISTGKSVLTGPLSPLGKVIGL